MSPRSRHPAPDSAERLLSAALQDRAHGALSPAAQVALDLAREEGHLVMVWAEIDYPRESYVLQASCRADAGRTFGDTLAALLWRAGFDLWQRDCDKPRAEVAYRGVRFAPFAADSPAAAACRLRVSTEGGARLLLALDPRTAALDASTRNRIIHTFREPRRAQTQLWLDDAQGVTLRGAPRADWEALRAAGLTRERGGRGGLHRLAWETIDERRVAR